MEVCILQFRIPMFKEFFHLANALLEDLLEGSAPLKAFLVS